MTIHKQQRVFAIGKRKQNAYGTPTAALTNNFQRLICSDQGFASHSVGTADNRDHATGFEQPTDTWTTQHDNGRNFEVDAGSDVLGLLLHYGMGSVVTDQPDAVSDPTVYRHEFEPADLTSSRQLPPFTYAEKVGSSLDRLFPDNVIESLNLSGDGSQRIKCAVSAVGSGRYVTPSNLTFPGLPTEVFFYNSQAKLVTDDGNEIDYGAGKRLNTWAFGIANNLLKEEGYRPGAAQFHVSGNPDSGVVRAECLSGGRDYTAEFTARFASQSHELAALRDQRRLSFLIELIGKSISGEYNHKLTIEATRVAYETVELGESNGLVTVSVRPKLLADPTAGAAGRPVLITLINTTASYTA